MPHLEHGFQLCHLGSCLALLHHRHGILVPQQPHLLAHHPGLLLQGGGVAGKPRVVLRQQGTLGLEVLHKFLTLVAHATGRLSVGDAAFDLAAFLLRETGVVGVALVGQRTADALYLL
jgi:hypothetical protein